MGSNDLIPYWFFGGTFALAAAIITASVLYGKKRTRELAAVAQQIGFTFVGRNWSGPSVSSEHKTSLLQKTRGRFSNVMTGSSGGLQISLFDYTYVVGKSTVTQTLAAFSQDLQLPPFALRPENVLDRIGEAFLHYDIDFDSNPEFSKRYLLRSPDEANTRRLFTPSLLAYIEQLPAEKKWHIEGTGPTLMVYRGGRPVSPFDMPSFLDETSTIARTFFASGGLRKPVA
jgi:hypothetical protein